MSSNPSGLKSVLVVGLLTVFLLLALEVLARVIHTVREDRATGSGEWYRFSSTLHWERRPGFSGAAQGKHRAFDAQGFFVEDIDDLVDREKSPILLAGDSRTFGTGVLVGETFGELLEARVTNACVVNCGVPGYTSYQGLVALTETIEVVRPAVVVISFGFNDRRAVLDPASADSAAYFARSSRKHRRMQRGLRSYIAGEIDSLVNRSRTEKVSIDTLRPRVDLAAYRANLTAMVELTRSRGAEPVLLLLGDNPSQTKLIDEGRMSVKAGDLAVAEAKFRLAIDGYGAFADIARRALSDLLTDQGRQAGAKDVRISAPVRSLHGGRPLVSDFVYGEVMKEVALSESVPLADAARIINAQPSRFVDYCHFDAVGHVIVADVLAEIVGPMCANMRR